MRSPRRSASSRSWLTNRMVFLTRSCSVSSSSCSLPRISGSSAEKGSSISRMSASVAKARASPTRCCMPPGQFADVALGPLRQADQLQFLIDDGLALRGAFAAQLQAEADVLAHRAPRQQAELLEHHGDALAPQPAHLQGVAGGDIDGGLAVANQHMAARHRVQAIGGAQQGGLAGARQAHQHRNLAARRRSSWRRRRRR